MRNNYVFLLLFSFYLSLCETNAVFAKTLEEGIKVQVENESLPQVFKRLEKVYGCQILFVYNDVNSYSFTGVIQEKNAGDAVKKVLEGKPFICKVDGTFINVALAKRTYQEKSGKIRVSGKVIDDKGMPMVELHPDFIYIICFTEFGFYYDTLTFCHIYTDSHPCLVIQI